MERSVILVLDSEEVALNADEIAILSGVNHVRSDRSNRPAVLAIASHDGT